MVRHSRKCPAKISQLKTGTRVWNLQFLRGIKVSAEVNFIPASQCLLERARTNRRAEHGVVLLPPFHPIGKELFGAGLVWNHGRIENGCSGYTYSNT